METKYLIKIELKLYSNAAYRFIVTLSKWIVTAFGNDSSIYTITAIRILNASLRTLCIDQSAIYV